MKTLSKSNIFFGILLIVAVVYLLLGIMQERTLATKVANLQNSNSQLVVEESNLQGANESLLLNGTVMAQQVMNTYNLIIPGDTFYSLAGTQNASTK